MAKAVPTGLPGGSAFRPGLTSPQKPCERFLPRSKNGTLHIATADPGNQRVIDDIRLLSGLEVKESEAPVSEILEKIAECYQVTVEQMIENLSPGQAATAESKNL